MGGEKMRSKDRVLLYNRNGKRDRNHGFDRREWDREVGDLILQRERENKTKRERWREREKERSEI